MGTPNIGYINFSTARSGFYLNFVFDPLFAFLCGPWKLLWKCPTLLNWIALVICDQFLIFFRNLFPDNALSAKCLFLFRHKFGTAKLKCFPKVAFFFCREKSEKAHFLVIILVFYYYLSNHIGSPALYPHKQRMCHIWQGHEGCSKDRIVCRKQSLHPAFTSLRQVRKWHPG